MTSMPPVAAGGGVELGGVELCELEPLLQPQLSTKNTNSRGIKVFRKPEALPSIRRLRRPFSRQFFKSRGSRNAEQRKTMDSPKHFSDVFSDAAKLFLLATLKCTFDTVRTWLTS